MPIKSRVKSNKFKSKVSVQSIKICHLIHSVRMSVITQYIYPFILSIYLSNYLSICQSISLFIYLSINVTICHYTKINILVYLYLIKISFSLYLFIYLSIFLSYKDLFLSLSILRVYSFARLCCESVDLGNLALLLLRSYCLGQ